MFESLTVYLYLHTFFHTFIVRQNRKWKSQLSEFARYRFDPIQYVLPRRFDVWVPGAIRLLHKAPGNVLPKLVVSLVVYAPEKESAQDSTAQIVRFLVSASIIDQQQ
jgi:hypothetical protein